MGSQHVWRKQSWAAYLPKERFSAPARWGGVGEADPALWLLGRLYREFPERHAAGWSQQCPGQRVHGAGSWCVPAGPSRLPQPRLGRQPRVPRARPRPEAATAAGRGGTADGTAVHAVTDEHPREKLTHRGAGRCRVPRHSPARTWHTGENRVARSPSEHLDGPASVV